MSRITLETVMGYISFIFGAIGVAGLDGYTAFDQSIIPILILLLISGITGYIALRESGYIQKRKTPNRRQAKLRESNKHHNNSTYVKYFQ